MLQRCTSALALLSFVAVVPATLPTVTAHAEVGQGYPGGCMVAVAAAAPSTCTYSSIGGEQERVSFVGTGTVSLTGCSAGSLAASPAGTYLTAPQSGGCTYTLSVTGSGLAVAVNQGPADFAECSDASDGIVLGDFSECFYDAVTSSGTAVAAAVSALPAEIDITVQDLSAGGGTVASCKVAGTGALHLSCPYAELVGHQYDVTASDPTFNDALLALVAEG